MNEYVDGSRNMADENNYSENEQIIGKWVDGKNIYRRFVEKTFDLHAVTWLALENTSDYNVENVVNCSIRRGSGGVFYPLCQKDVDDTVAIYYPIQVYGCIGYVLEYTKMTDTAANN